MDFLCKINGDMHVQDAPSRPKNASDWEGAKIEVPFPRKLTGGASNKRISPNDALWIWTHEDQNYGNGLGLTAKATAGCIIESDTEYGKHYFIEMLDVQLQKPHFRLDETREGTSGSRIIEAIRGYRLHQAIEMDDDILLEFNTAVEKLKTKKLMLIKQAENRYIKPSKDTPEMGALHEEKETIRRNFKGRYSLREDRPGQSAFRASLLKLYQGSCIVSGCQIKELLQAAHIVPFSKVAEYRDNPTNGLLLRADIHLLFDRMLFSISPKSGKISIDQSLVGTEYGYLEGQIVKHVAAIEFISKHWEMFNSQNLD